MIALPLAALLLAAAPPVTRPELEKLGARIAADFQAGRDGLTPLFDVDGLLERSLAGVPAPEEFKAGFRKGAKKSGVPLGANLLKAAKAGGRITFRSLGRIGGEDVIRLRLIHAGGAFNYVELFTARGAGGEVRVVDVYDLAEGSTLSTNVRRLSMIAIGEAKMGILDRLTGKERVFLDNAEGIKKLAAARGAGRFKEALAVYDGLPKEIQDEPFFMRQAVYAAMEVDERRYKRLMDRYMGAHPHDTAANIMAVDACFLRRDWAGAFQAIDRLERYVGTDDGWVEMLRGSVAKTAGDAKGAQHHFELAAKREPGLHEAHANLLDIYLAARDWAGVAGALAGLERGGQAIGDLRKVEGFEEFVASKEGKAFLARKKAR